MMVRGKTNERDSRIQRAIVYIDRNQDEVLSLHDVAAVAAVSPHHFHRLFLAETGFTPADYIRFQRFKRAAYQLAFHQEKPLIQIAYDACYATPEAFSKAFSKKLRVSPTRFRKQPDFSLWSRSHSSQLPQEGQTMTVKIRNFTKTVIACKEHHGSIEKVHETLRAFVAWRKKNGPSPKISRTFNIYYDDPELVAAKNYRMDVGAEIRSTIKENDHDIVRKVIPDLKCAMLRHQGSWEGLGRSMRYLYNDWLPNSGYQTGSFPIFVERVNLYPEVAETDLITDIYLPLKVGD